MSNRFSIVFPGQGSQSVGMLGDLAADWPVVGETFAEASEALDEDLWALASGGPRERLDCTEITQPVMLAAGVSVWRVWIAAGGAAPAWMAGHSLGEFTALVCAGSLSYADAVRLVSKRGRYMQDAVPPGSGAMAAVLGLSDERMAEVCAEAANGEVLEAVNFNSPGQVVIAGDSAAVERGIAVARAAGAKRAVRLPVSVPSHCALMRPAAERLAEELRQIPVQAPQVPVLHNASAAPAADPAEIRGLLVRQLYSPVRWVETVLRLAEEGCARVLEAGPGKVLAGLTRRIDGRLQSIALGGPEELAAALEVTRDA